MRKLKLVVPTVVTAFCLTATIAMAGTLADVKAKGFIQAGVNGDLFGFGKPDDKGVWKGLDVDTARAIAAAIFGDADKVKYTPLTAKARFTALQSGEIDVLTRNCAQTLPATPILDSISSRSTIMTVRAFSFPKNSE